MGPLMPSKALNPRAYAAIHLPTVVGGFGLGFSDELLSWFRESPDPHHWILAKILLGGCSSKDLRIFRRLNLNTSSRGIESIQEAMDCVAERLNSTSRPTDLSWYELQQKFPTERDNPRRLLATAELEGYLPVEEIAKRATRGDLFQALLCKREKLKIFNTRPFIETYKHVWRLCEEENLDLYKGIDWSSLDNKIIATALKNVSPQKFIKYTEYVLCTFKQDNDGQYDCALAKANHLGPSSQEKILPDKTYLSVPMLEALQIGKPQLSLGKAFIGLERF